MSEYKRVQIDESDDDNESIDQSINPSTLSNIRLVITAIVAALIGFLLCFVVLNLSLFIDTSQSTEGSINQSIDLPLSLSLNDGVDPFYVPQHASYKQRNHWLDRHVPLDYLNELRDAVMNGRSLPDQPIHQSKLSYFFANYTIFHAQSVKNQNNDTRLLVYQTGQYKYQGMGNRLNGLISSMLYAALTNRVLVLDPHVLDTRDGYALTDLFELPPIDWRLSSITTYDKQTLRELIHDSPIIDLTQWTKLTGTIEAFDIMLCQPYHNDAPHNIEPIVRLHSNQFFAPLIYHNPRYRSVVESHGFQIGRIMPPLARYLLRLKPHLLKQVDEFKKAHFRRYNIGVQLRTLDGHESTDMITATAFHCSSALANALPIDWLQSDDVGLYLATDNITMALPAARQLMDERLVNALATYICPTNDLLSKEGIECAVIEMFIMSEMDDMVMSKASTFGDVPHAIGMFAAMTLTQTPICMRQAAVDPCVHIWAQVKQLSCYNPKTMVQFEDSNGYCMGAGPDQIDKN